MSENATLVGDFVQRLSATRRCARLARLLAVQQLDAWGVPYGSEPSDVAATVVSELAANAALHGRVPGRDFELRLVLRPDRTLCIEVSDARSERPPTPPAGCPAPDAESGRGLFLVQAPALRWGVRERSVGKTVWADVSMAPDVDLTAGDSPTLCGGAVSGEGNAFALPRHTPHPDERMCTLRDRKR